MTARELFDAIGLVADDLILAADAPPVRRKPALWRQALPLAACFCVIVGVAQATGLNPLGRTLDLVMPRAGSSAPSSAALVTESAAEEAQDSGEDVKDEAAAADAYAFPEEGEAPILLEGYEAYTLCLTGDWQGSGVALQPGVPTILTADGAPFPSGTSLALTVTGEDGPVPNAVVGCAPAGGAPAVYASAPDEDGCYRLRTPAEAQEYYFFVICPVEATAAGTVYGE
ncbi:MAG: hypothetical protein ACI4OI_02270 [Gemmiger sp.]